MAIRDHPCFQCQFFGDTDILATCGDFIRVPYCSISGQKEFTLGRCDEYHVPEYLEQMMSNTKFDVKVRFFGEKQK